MNSFSIYISLIILIKVIFIILTLSYIYLKIKNKDGSSLASKISYWKKRTEFLFVFLMSLLLIYLFYPKSNRNMSINYETKLLLYLFGFVLLITAKWDVFFKESKWLEYIQSHK